MKQSQQTIRKPIQEGEITLEMINEATMIMAEMVEQYGDMYLLIFIRLLREAENYKELQSYKDIALLMLSNRSNV